MTAAPGIEVEVAAPSGRGVDARRASRRFLELVPRDFARQHLVLSQGEMPADGPLPIELLVAGERTGAAAVFNIGVRLRAAVHVERADAAAIAAAIDEAYADHVEATGSSASSAGPHEEAIATADQPAVIDALLAQADRDLLSTEGKAPVVRLIDALLFEALTLGASDVHVQPLADRTLVRYRLDGVLRTVRELPPRLTAPVVSRIKVMGRMDIAERRLPQDGRATVTVGAPATNGTATSSAGRAVDLRISTLPTSYGERAVLRLLDQRRQLCEFERLGMPLSVAEPFLRCARRNNGIVLVTGPTGSGKTTTLYSTLREVGSPEVNIMTIEDPIEYELATVGLAISQAQVNPRKGVTFATGLRHILRQDPDIVMVGEIRDAETARVAIQSSLTGHLVFSTLHTNDAASAVTRLIDLGVEPYLVGASLLAVLAQRLVRMVHPPCGGAGCESCAGTGYRGRTGIFELLVLNEAIRALVVRNAALAEIRAAARSAGMRTLQEEGERLVRAGTTTTLEVERVAHDVDSLDTPPPGPAEHSERAKSDDDAGMPGADGGRP